MQALRFYGSFNVTVTGITIQNSPQCHLKFDNCMGVSVHDMSVSSPGDSPNTDGIHLQNSKDVLIRSSNLACGNYFCFRSVFCHSNCFTKMNYLIHLRRLMIWLPNLYPIAISFGNRFWVKIFGKP